jgi:putative oxidoreductase
MDLNAIIGNRWVRRGLSLIVGGVFVYAGVIKIGGPQSLADTVAEFGILPNFAIVAFALGLPVFEILAGLLLVSGWRARVGALAVAIAIVAYIGAIGTALARGLTIDCGCFGAAPATRAGMWLDLARDLAILAGAAAVYLTSFPRESEQP